MTDIIVSNVLGFILGIVASFVSWWILFHGLVPRVVFGEFLCKSAAADEPVGWRFRFQFANVGRRSLIDVHVTARLSVPKGNDLWDNVSLALHWNGDKKVEVPRMKRTGYLAYRVFPNQVVELQKSAVYPAPLREKASEGTLSLEDLMSPPVSARLTVFIAGYDELSGARKVFESKAYTFADIREGKFAFLTVVPAEAPLPPAA